MSDTRKVHRAGDGFTLVEVLIVITLIGVIAVAISAVFSVIVRTLPPTEARADDARSLLGISTWLPADVSSTPRAPLASAATYWDDSPTRATGCTGGDQGRNIVRLSWREQIGGSPTTYVASYRLVDDPESARIIRVTCVGTGTATVQNVTAGLPLSATSPVHLEWKTLTELGVTYIIGLEMELTTFEGDTLRVDASSRNPAQTLSTIPDAVTTLPPPTSEEPTTTTSSTLPPETSSTIVGETTTTTTSTTTTTTTTTVPCAASFLSVVPNPVENTASGNGQGNQIGKLKEAVTVTIAKSGNCSELVLRYVRAPSAPNATSEERAPTIKVFGQSITLTLLSTDTERWEKGNRPLQLVEHVGLPTEKVHDTRILVVT